MADEKREISKLYKNKEILDERKVSLFKQIDGLGDICPSEVLSCCESYETDNYWESGVNRFDLDIHSAMHHCVDLLIKTHPTKQDSLPDIKISARDTKIENENPWCRAVRIFLYLLNAGVSVNSRKLHKEDLSYTPLEYAIEKGAHKDILELLIKYGAYVDTFDSEGYTPLLQALWNCDVDAVEILLRAGANPNAQYQDGSTLLHIAFGNIYADMHFSKCKKIIELLLEHGANPNLLNNKYETCMESRYSYSNADPNYVVERLLGISLEILELRNYVRQFAKRFAAPQRTAEKFIESQVQTFRELAEIKAEVDGINHVNNALCEAYGKTAYMQVKNLELSDEIKMRIYKKQPISTELLHKAFDADVDDELIDQMLPLCPESRLKDLLTGKITAKEYASEPFEEEVWDS